MFTSGTSGRPKGVILPRLCYTGTKQAEFGSVTICHRPAHWIGGLRHIIVPAITGVKLLALGEMATATQVLDAFSQHRITHASFSPPILRQMRDLLMSRDGGISEEALAMWAGRFKYLGAIRCSAGVLEPSTMQFWTHLTGLPLENMYAATELGGVAIRSIQSAQACANRVQQGSIGSPIPGVQVKLSEGSKGEMSIKSPKMFLGSAIFPPLLDNVLANQPRRSYLDDQEITSAALDEDGYFRTGDLAELKDGEYLFRGRALSDCSLPLQVRNKQS